MLKLIHVQARLSVSKGQAVVKQMQSDDLVDRQRAAEIIAIFEQALAARLTRDALQIRLDDYTDIRLDYREIDGLAKVIADSFATFTPELSWLETATPPPNAENANTTQEDSTNNEVEVAEAANSNLAGLRLAVWQTAAQPEFYPFNNSNLTVALKPGIKSLQRAAIAHNEDLLNNLLPAEKRSQIFEKAASTAGYTLQKKPIEIETSQIFNDLPGRQRLVALSPTLNIDNLLNRYNIELLRGVLYLAPRLRIIVRDKYKDLFKFIKLFGLMHELKPLAAETKNDQNPPKQKNGHTKSKEDKDNKINSAENNPILAENEIEGYEIILEGASSPFLARSDRRYGIQFAKFLPALLLCEAEWSLETELILNTSGSPVREGSTTKSKARVVKAQYKLGPQPHLRSHFKASGEFDSLLEENLAKAFEERFKQTTRKTIADKDDIAVASTEQKIEEGAEEVKPKRKRKTTKPPPQAGEREGWTIQREDRIIPVFDTVMIPDFAFEHVDGRRALLEIVGFWERGYLERKIAKLNRAGRSDIIVLVSERTRCGRENFLVKGQDPVYQLLFFKGTPRLGPIMEALERCAIPAPTATSPSAQSNNHLSN
jgi:predicted nuclease of restriction endonuclease-like RecB superfamily